MRNALHTASIQNRPAASRQEADFSFLKISRRIVPTVRFSCLWLWLKKKGSPKGE
jgi:hypothetical protein